MARNAFECRVFSTVTSVLFLFLWRVCSGVDEDKDVHLLQHQGLRLEQFLWTGSGDGEDYNNHLYNGEINPTPPVVITTIIHTTTIHTTVFPPSVFTTSSAMLPGNDPDDCFGGQDCYDIHPTPTLRPPSQGNSVPPWPPPLPSIPDERYWIVTILRTQAAQFYLTPAELEPRLARLYRIAFHRSQERHLGLNGSNNYWNASTSLLLAKEVVRNRFKRTADVVVRVHNVTSNGRLRLLYSVRVDGKPVLADAAVKDMRLVTDTEVTAELGHPVLSKAEPYLKEDITPLLSGQSRHPGETWFLIGLSLFAFIILFGICLIGYLTLNRWQTNQRSTNQRQVFEREIRSGRGLSNFGYKSEIETTNEMESSRIVPLHSRSSRDSTTTGSQASLVKPSPAKRSSILKQATPHPHPRAHVQSPKSYLSMPSVKSFPRGADMPEPLSHVLEPQDVRSSGVPTQPPLTRHKSVEGDPGVIGPIVWDLHCHRVKKLSRSDLAPSPTRDLDDDDEILSEPNMSAGGMRKRFHELLDDAFSLFSSKSSSDGSERNSPPQTSPTTGENRSKSAVIRPVCDEVITEDTHRPRTSTDLIPVRPSTSSGLASPRGAWDTNPSTPGSRPHARPLSAGPFHRPTLEPAIILADGKLNPNDPAVPLIEAIKRELDRFPPVSSARERRPLQHHPDHSYA